MTCNGCVAFVTQKLLKIDGVTAVDIALKDGQASIVMSKNIAIEELANALPDKYLITKEVTLNDAPKKTKLQQLKPLFLIFAYLFGASFLLHYKAWNTTEVMLDFMGLFYIVSVSYTHLTLPTTPYV